MSDKPITWQQGIAVVGGAFGLCCMGFMLLHSMILSDKAYASDQLSQAVATRTAQMNRIADTFESYRHQNDIDHKEIMQLLLKMTK
jgi:hypothetical protein